MEKYTKAQMEVIEFENEDVITSSTICPDNCTFDGVSCGNLIHVCKKLATEETE